VLLPGQEEGDGWSWAFLGWQQRDSRKKGLRPQRETGPKVKMGCRRMFSNLFGI
jgi:hypothetical protein